MDNYFAKFRVWLSLRLLVKLVSAVFTFRYAFVSCIWDGRFCFAAQRVEGEIRLERSRRDRRLSVSFFSCIFHFGL